jgi:hypothetical protein
LWGQIKYYYNNFFKKSERVRLRRDGVLVLDGEPPSRAGDPAQGIEELQKVGDEVGGVLRVVGHRVEECEAKSETPMSPRLLYFFISRQLFFSFLLGPFAPPKKAPTAIFHVHKNLGLA